MEEKKNRPLLDSAETLRGSGRPKKNRLPAVIAVCVIVIACVGGLAAMRMSRPQQEETALPSLALVEFAAADVDSIQMISTHENYTLRNDNGFGYSIDGMDSFEVDASTARRMIAQSGHLIAQSIVSEKASNMAEYGLANPTVSVSIRNRNGESKTVYIGDQSPVSSYYACIAGQDTVYALAPTVAETLMKPLRDLHAVATPSIAEPYAPAHLCIEWPEETEKRGMRVLEIQKQPRKDIGIGASNYMITQPITYDVDVAALAALVENIAAIKAESYAGEMTDPSAYGMERAVTLIMRDTAGTEVCMEIGNKIQDQQRYLRFDQKSAVYSIAAEKLAFLDEITLAGSIDRFISLVGIGKMEEIAVSAQDRVDVIRILPQEEQVLYTVNGHEVEEDAFKTFYQELCALTANGIVMEAEKLNGPDIVMHFKLADGIELHVEYIAFDRENYAVRRDGSTYVYVQKSKLAQLLEKLYALE